MTSVKVPLRAKISSGQNGSQGRTGGPSAVLTAVTRKRFTELNLNRDVRLDNLGFGEPLLLDQSHSAPALFNLPALASLTLPAALSCPDRSLQPLASWHCRFSLPSTSWVITALGHLPLLGNLFARGADISHIRNLLEPSLALRLQL